jgi:hypothetical protein
MSGKWMKFRLRIFKKMILGMINGIKEDVNKCLNKFQENCVE